jgi:hypothetical protein
MSFSLISALFFTVALLVTSVYFLLGSVPLLTLKHDTPLDARFVRGYFNVYYRAAIFTALATCLSYAFSGRPTIAIGAGALAVVAVVMRGQIIPKMDLLGPKIQISPGNALPAFRRVHMTAIAVNLVQICFMVWSLISTSMHLKA